MIPLGAIHNGRVFIERIQSYGFECQGGSLENCGDWQQLVSCFEHLSEWAESQDAATPEGYALVPHLFPTTPRTQPRARKQKHTGATK